MRWKAAHIHIHILAMWYYNILSFEEKKTTQFIDLEYTEISKVIIDSDKMKIQFKRLKFESDQKDDNTHTE